MIHIMRENETTDDLGEIYGVNKNLITIKNSPHAIFSEGSAVYIPTEGEVFFTERDMTLPEVSLKTGVSEEVLIKHNPHIQNKVIKKNTRISYPLNGSLKDIFSGMYRLSGINSDFTEIDRKNTVASKIFIVCYKKDANGIILPADYPAINACRINGIIPAFYIDSPEEFSDEDTLSQIKQDLVYKDYREVLINVRFRREIPHAKILTEFFRSIDLAVSLKGNEKILTEFEYENYNTLYFAPRRNIFDFNGFAGAIDELIDHIPVRYLGYEFTHHAARVDKTDMKIDYPSAEEIKNIFERNSCRISYDELSKLCFYRYGEDNSKNVIYEDLRGIYSKAKYLHGCGIDRFLLSELSEDVRYAAGKGYTDGKEMPSDLL